MAYKPPVIATGGCVVTSEPCITVLPQSGIRYDWTSPRFNAGDNIYFAHTNGILTYVGVIPCWFYITAYIFAESNKAQIYDIAIKQNNVPAAFITSTRFTNTPIGTSFNQRVYLAVNDTLTIQYRSPVNNTKITTRLNS